MKIQPNAILAAPCIQHVSLNNYERAFVVGDIHGDYQQLKKALERVDFVANVDVLFCLGDMIDRGPESVKVLSLLSEIGAVMLLGNHEQLMLESVLCNNAEATRLWCQNGGTWHKGVSDTELKALCESLLALPLSVVVDYQGCKIGLSHTISTEWDWLNFPNEKSTIVNSLLWERSVVKKRKVIENAGVDFSVHGHNPIQVPVWIANTYHIDTSYYGRLCILELNDVIERFRNHITRATTRPASVR